MFILDTFMLPLTHTYTLLRVVLQQVIVCRLNADLTRSCKRQRCAATSHLPSSNACLQTYVASAMPRTLFLYVFKCKRLQTFSLHKLTLLRCEKF